MHHWRPGRTAIYEYRMVDLDSWNAVFIPDTAAILHGTSKDSDSRYVFVNYFSMSLESQGFSRFLVTVEQSVEGN
jgi:hypothetical protein